MSTAEDKSYWFNYSSVSDPETGEELFINSSSESWALFKDGQFIKESHSRENLPENIQPLWDEFFGDEEDEEEEEDEG